MPDSIEWLPKSAPVILPFTGTSHAAVAKALHSTFGNFPIQLNKFEHSAVLRGMCAAAGDGSEPYIVLHRALEKFGEIEVRVA